MSRVFKGKRAGEKDTPIHTLSERVDAKIILR